MLVRELNCSAKTGRGTQIWRGGAAPFAPLLATAITPDYADIPYEAMVRSQRTKP